MGKVELNVFRPVGEVNLDKSKLEIVNGVEKVRLKLEEIFLTKGYLLLVIGFLLGRALILTELTPFILPFFAAVYFIKRDKSPLALLGLIGGGATLSLQAAVYTFAITFGFLVFFRVTKKYIENELRALPFYVFFILLLGGVGRTFILTSHLTLYDWMITGVEASLGYILTLIFLQSLPLLNFNKRRQTLTTEEIVCLIILLASILTGTIGWSVYDLSIEHIMSMYLVLVFAYVGGATIGSTVGVVTGLVFSLANISSFYQISLLAFAGLMGGLLKEGKKPGVAIGLFIAVLLIGMYGEGGTSLYIMMLEAAAAVGLFILTPQALTSKLSKHIPGTAEHAQEQQQYLRKMRDVTVSRIVQFSSVFKDLSNSFSFYDGRSEEESEQREKDLFLSKVTERTCNVCFKKNHCWARVKDETYGFMNELVDDMHKNGGTISPKLIREFRGHCFKEERVTNVIDQEFSFYQANKKLKKQIRESRKLVSEQLMGVSEVMKDFAEEIRRERDNHHKQEDAIYEALRDLGVRIENIEIYSLEQGNVDIEVTIPFCHGHGQCEKLIAPMLSDILKETIIVKREKCASYPNGFCHATFCSAKAYTVDTGVAYTGKGGGFISGDSYSTVELNSGKYAVAISDGMGNGHRARLESFETLKLLKRILQSGIEEELAIKSINSILSLRTTDEIFSTLDLAMLDLQSAKAKVIKIGACPTFIKRGDQIMKIQASNLPMGILQDIEVDVVNVQLKAGDMLIMMSDGIFEGAENVENHDMWIKRKIGELESKDPQELASFLFDEVIRTNAGYIGDDMTVVVTKIMHNTPKWATIPVHEYRKNA